MSEEYRRVLLNEMMSWPTADAEFVIRRETITPGATFSEEAMEKLNDQLIVFIGTRLMRRWDQTNEPPTALRVAITVDVG